MGKARLRKKKIWTYIHLRTYEISFEWHKYELNDETVYGFHFSGSILAATRTYSISNIGYNVSYVNHANKHESLGKTDGTDL